MNISQSLNIWYKAHKRDLPWRNTNDPYKIWISEIILQQTRVNQGLNYYYRFIQRFPNVKVLADSTIDEVMLLWQGLGYYSRARNMYETALIISNKYNGVFPKSFEEIKSLKGVGEYTAAAIASFAFNIPVPVVDGNVIRVIARIFGITDDVTKASGRKQVSQAANIIIDKDMPALFNQAIMEFGALQCITGQPDCVNCPLNSICVAYSKDLVKKLPIKSKKAKSIDRFIFYFIIKQNDSIYIRYRTQKDIWENLYDFPSIESYEKQTLEYVFSSDIFRELFLNDHILISEISNEVIHKLSHQNLHIHFIQIKLDEQNSVSQKDLIKIQINQIQDFPFPIVIHRYIQDHLK